MGTVLAPPQAVDVTLALFGGTDTEISPSDVPEGLSPDNQDMIFLPGDTSSRPCLSKNFATPFPNGVSVVYEKTYMQPNNEPLTLVLTSDGKLWVEDVTNSPGTATQIGSVPQGLYAQSVTAFGREYIAFSDLLHGQGVPLQFDGTNLDRVTQDGPGAGPTVANFIPAPATIANPSAPISATITATGINWGGLEQINPNPPPNLFYFTFFTVNTTTPHGFTAGQKVTISGASPAEVNGTFTIAAVLTTTQFQINYFIAQGTASPGGNGTATETVSNTSMSRSGNIVTAVTNAAHGFQVGWQVAVSGIANNDIGGGISSISRDVNGVVTVVTASAHGLPIGATIAIDSVSNPDASFNGTFTVTGVLSATSFTYQQGGTVEDSTLGSGNVQDVWNATVFIQSIPSTTSFTYQQTGPNDTTTASGTATVVGQVSPGIHGVVVMFLTRSGYLTKPSPPIFVGANGAQQFSISNLPIGPSNVVARVLGFTGAGGDNYFTIPAVPQVSGQIVGTSLIIPDNITSSVTIDFSDNTLFEGIALDVTGNDLFDQAVLGPVLGFFRYASRMSAWGDFNNIENFLNMGFCGGYLSGNLNGPLGWTVETSGGVLVNGGSWTGGMSWQITGDGTINPKGRISQPAFQDADGTAILTPNTQYTYRVWAKVNTLSNAGFLAADLFSPTVGLLAQGGVNVAAISTTGEFHTVVLVGTTPTTIPSDAKLRLYTVQTALGTVVTFGENGIIYTDDPFINNLSKWSYAENPEAFALTTGQMGPADDDSPIRCFSLQRNVSLLKTAECTHDFQDNNEEPGTWVVNALSHSVGSVSLRGGDPGKFGTGDASEDWDLTASRNGLYISAGSVFWKVSQEMSKGQQASTAITWEDINWACEQTIWVKNDPNSRRAYIGVPVKGATAPNLIFVLDYREMDTAQQIAAALPIHITLTGKMKSSDMTRKWGRWNIPANCGEILIRPGNQKQFFLGGGSGSTPGTGTAFGNIYSLDTNKLTDDDYGAMDPYYVTYAFVDHDQEQQLQLGSARHFYSTIHAFVTGVGLVTITPLVDSLYNMLPPTSPRLLTSDLDSGTALPMDLSWKINVRGERVFFKINVQPLPGSTDVQLKLQKFIVWMMKDPVAQFRGSAI